MSQLNQFSPGLTGIRALAALMVLSHHIFALAIPRVLSFSMGDWQVTYHWLFTCSWMGANVFFVLSGYLLAIPFVRHIEGQGKRVETFEYLVRRVKRVVPAYWVQIIILCTVMYFMSALPSWQVIASHLFFLQNLQQNYASAINGVYWTLPTEFGYYLLLPIFAAIACAWKTNSSRTWLLLCALLVVSAIAYRTLMQSVVADAPVATRVYVLMQLPGLLDHFAIGMFLAWVHIVIPRPLSPRISDGLVIFGLSGIVVMMALVDHFYLDYWNGHAMVYVGYTFTAAFIGAVVFGTAAAGRISNALFANRPMLFIGTISYSVYLWHIPILNWILRYLDSVGVQGDRLWWLIGFGVPLSFVAGSASYYLVERPYLTPQVMSGISNPTR